MNLDKYPVISDNNHITYEFLSAGPNGTIKKVVYYQEVGRNVFNLAFGDWDEAEQRINDLVRSNNNDRDKVLATVASTVFDFMMHHQNAVIFAKGSTGARTRLYQIGIFNNWKEISQIFDVEGFAEDKWEPVIKNKNYEAFVLTGK